MCVYVFVRGETCSVCYTNELPPKGFIFEKSGVTGVACGRMSSYVCMQYTYTDDTGISPPSGASHVWAVDYRSNSQGFAG